MNQRHFRFLTALATTFLLFTSFSLHAQNYCQPPSTNLVSTPIDTTLINYNTFQIRNNTGGILSSIQIPPMSTNAYNYIPYSASSIHFTAGSSYSIVLKATIYSNNFPALGFMPVWVDFNANGNFETGEYIPVTEANGTMITVGVMSIENTYTFNVPATAGANGYRIRFGISMDSLNANTPCGVFNNARISDVDVNAPTITVIDSVVVTTGGGAPAMISTAAGTLPMVANIYPASASQNVVWSITPGTGSATISTAGVVTATANGTVWAKATSVQDTTKSDSLLVTITNQSSNVHNLIESFGLKVYPNPVIDQLNIIFENNHPKLSLSILDITGRVLLSNKYGANSLRTGQGINVAQLSSGSYFVKFEMEHTPYFYLRFNK